MARARITYTAPKRPPASERDEDAATKADRLGEIDAGIDNCADMIAHTEALLRFLEDEMRRLKQERARVVG